MKGNMILSKKKFAPKMVKTWFFSGLIFHPVPSMLVNCESCVQEKSTVKIVFCWRGKYFPFKKLERRIETSILDKCKNSSHETAKSPCNDIYLSAKLLRKVENILVSFRNQMQLLPPRGIRKAGFKIYSRVSAIFAD